MCYQDTQAIQFCKNTLRFPVYVFSMYVFLKHVSWIKATHADLPEHGTVCQRDAANGKKVLEKVVACKAALDILSTGQAKAGGPRSEFLCSGQELFCSLPLTELWEIGVVSGTAEEPLPLLPKSLVSVYKVWEHHRTPQRRMQWQQDQVSAAVLLLRTGMKLRGGHLMGPTRNPG